MKAKAAFLLVLIDTKCRCSIRQILLSSFLVIVGRSPRCQLICFDLYGYDHEHTFHAFALALTLDGNTENTYKE
jgi:hypothetical protein